jgi:hypothetical protein
VQADHPPDAVQTDTGAPPAKEFGRLQAGEFAKQSRPLLGRKAGALVANGALERTVGKLPANVDAAVLEAVLGRRLRGRPRRSGRRGKSAAWFRRGNSSPRREFPPLGPCRRATRGCVAHGAKTRRRRPRAGN